MKLIVFPRLQNTKKIIYELNTILSIRKLISLGLSAYYDQFRFIFWYKEVIMIDNVGFNESVPTIIIQFIKVSSGVN